MAMETVNRRSRLNIWLVFADFFCCIGLLILGAYGNRALKVEDTAKDKLFQIYNDLRTKPGWQDISYDADTYSISVGQAVLFGFDQRDVPDHGKLDSLVSVVKEVDLSEFVLIISGHTDAYGTIDYNMGLSRVRAENVGNYLSDRLDPTKYRIAMRGLGPLEPKVDNCAAPGPDSKPRHTCEGGRLKPKEELEANRRIELTLGIYSPATISAQTR